MDFILFLLVFGLILSILIAYRVKTRSRCTTLVVATVVDFDYHEDTDHKTGKTTVTYNPIFEYDWKGWTRTLQGNVFSSKHDFEIGDKVELYINPKDSSEFIYKEAKNDPLIGTAFTLFSILGIFIIFYLLRGGN